MWFSSLLGKHAWSTYMIIGGMVLIAFAIHPSLLGFLLIGITAGWQFIVREVARIEGSHHKFSFITVAIALLLIAACIFFMLHVNWLVL